MSSRRALRGLASTLFLACQVTWGALVGVPPISRCLRSRLPCHRGPGTRGPGPSPTVTVTAQGCPDGHQVLRECFVLPAGVRFSMQRGCRSCTLPHPSYVTRYPTGAGLRGSLRGRLVDRGTCGDPCPTCRVSPWATASRLHCLIGCTSWVFPPLSSGSSAQGCAGSPPWASPAPLCSGRYILVGHGSPHEGFAGNGFDAVAQHKVSADCGCDLPTGAVPPALIRRFPQGEGLRLSLSATAGTPAPRVGPAQGRFPVSAM